MKAKRYPALLAFYLAASLPALGQQLTYFPVDRSVLEERLRVAPATNRARAEELEELLTRAGCPAVEKQEVRGSKLPNIICRLEGESEETILVGGHYDKVSKGHGVADNWAGASMLASLLEGLAKSKPHHTFRFVGFTDEEKGLVGSRAFVKQMSKAERELLVGMVNLDTLGLGPTAVWASRSDDNLKRWLFATAGGLGLSVQQINVEQVGTTDSEPFRKKGFAVLTLHSLTTQTLPLLHSQRDNLKAIQWDEYFDTYRLVLAYLVVLDQKLRLD